MGRIKREPESDHFETLRNVRLRSELGDIARRDWRAALARIDEMSDRWYRCQALAQIAWEAGDGPEFDEIIKRALDDARGIADHNRCVCVSSWPIQARAERNRGISAIVTEMIRRGRKEPLASCRANAFGTLLVGVWPAGPTVRQRVLTELIDAAKTLEHWRCGVELARAAEHFVYAGERGAVEAIRDALPEGRDRRRIERVLHSAGFPARRYFRAG